MAPAPEGEEEEPAPLQVEMLAHLLLTSMNAKEQAYGPYVTAFLDGKPCTAMIDSGNLWRTVISKDFAVRLGLNLRKLRKTYNDVVQTAKRDAFLEILGETHRLMSLRLGGLPHAYSIRPIVLEGLTMDMNISGPFLQENKIDHLHSKGCLRVKGKDIPLRSASGYPLPTDQKESAVYLLEDVTVEPDTLVSAPGMVAEVANGCMMEGTGLWFDDPKELDKAGLSSVGFAEQACDIYGSLTVGCMNLSDHPVTLSKGQRWGIFSLSPEATRTIELDGEVEDIEWTDRMKRNWLIREFKLDSRPKIRTKEQQEKVLEVLLRHWSIFSTDGNFGRTDLIEHEIHLTNEKPIRCKYRPIMNPDKEASLRKQLDIWLEHGVIEKANSPWSFAMVSAPKKGTDVLRWCVDYRPLNDVTVPDATPIPSIEDNLSKLSGSDTFSGIDGMGAFHVVPMRAEDKCKTAFSTPWGAFQFLRMPFGLSNGPATYTRLVNAAMSGIPPSVALPYLDDTIVHSKGFEAHLKALDVVLAAFAKAGLKLQPSKCNLFEEKVEYLGHMVSKDGITLIDYHTKVIKEWPLPTNKTQARSFLGKVSYYRRFIKDFASLVKCWTDITGKQEGETGREPIVVTQRMREVFDILKAKLLSYPILAYPRFRSTEPFILDTDWSQEHNCVGAVLSQKQDGQERVILYGAKKLPSTVRGYSPTIGEMKAVITFVQKWRPYLSFRRFILRTDHHALKWIKSLNTSSGMEWRWRQILADFDFTVEYRPGCQHGNADALSRIDHAEPAEEEKETLLCMIAPLTRLRPQVDLPSLPEEWRSCQLMDPCLSNVYQWVASDEWPNLNAQRALSPEERHFCSLGHRLYLTPKGVLQMRAPPANSITTDPVPCAPRHLYPALARHAHRLVGHKGGRITTEQLNKMAHVFAARKEVEKAIRDCPQCQEMAGDPGHHDLGDAVPDGHPFQRLSLDFVGPLPISRGGNEWVLTVKDTFTRWLEAFPLPAATAEAVAHKLEREIFSRYGYPGCLHSDQGSQFTSKLIWEVAALLDLKLTTTPAYHPQSNPVERSHRDLKPILRRLMAEQKGDDWEDLLPQALFAIRTANNRHTGVSPFQALFGRDPPMPVDLLEMPPVAKAGPKRTAYVQKLEERIRAVQTYVRSNLADLLLRKKNEYRGRAHKYQPGDLVWLFTPPRGKGKGGRKFATGWTGPWMVDKIINPAILRLQPDERWSITANPEVATDRVKPFYTPARPLEEFQPDAEQDLECRGDEDTEVFRLPLPAERRKEATEEDEDDWESVAYPGAGAPARAGGGPTPPRHGSPAPPPTPPSPAATPPAPQGSPGAAAAPGGRARTEAPPPRRPLRRPQLDPNQEWAIQNRPPRRQAGLDSDRRRRDVEDLGVRFDRSLLREGRGHQRALLRPQYPEEQDADDESEEDTFEEAEEAFDESALLSD